MSPNRTSDKTNTENAVADPRIVWIGSGGLVLSILTFALVGLRVAADSGFSITSWIVLGAATVFFGSSIVLRLTGNIEVSGALIPGGGLVALFFMALFENGLRSEAIVWIPFAPLIALFFVGRRAAIGFGAVAVLGIATIARIGPWGWGTNGDWTEVVPAAASAAAAVSFAAFFAWLFDSLRQRTKLTEVNARADIERMMAAIPALVFLLDRDNDVLLSNPSGRRNPHVSRGGSISGLFDAQESSRLRKLLNRCRNESKPITVSLPGCSQDRKEQFEVHMVPVADGCLVVIARDITDQHEAARLKDDFVSMVSHELRTPLTAISGSLALIEGGVVQIPPKAQEMVRLAKRNSDRLGLLIDDILDLRRIETGHMTFHVRTLSALEALKSCRDANSAYADSFDVKVEVAGDPHALKLRADPDRLQQALTNLVANAVKHSPRFETVALGAEQYGDRVRLSVMDSGPGIPTSFQGKVFERFSQADGSTTRKAGGSGLGLSITKLIVESMGGEIDFTSDRQRGTTFYIVLDRPARSPSGSRAIVYEPTENRTDEAETV